MAEAFPHVLNVISDDASRLANALRPVGEARWLSEGRAFDIAFNADPEAVRTEAERAAKDTRADINVLPAVRRRKKLLVADMDSTIVSCECLDELADMAGLKPRVAAITERAMRGEIAFEGALRERVALLKGLPVSAIQRVLAERVRLTPGAVALVRTMRKFGAHALLVSGGFSTFTRAVAAWAGFDAEQANELIDDGERLAGLVREPILGREAKLGALVATVKQLGIEEADALAVGDGANDLDMIKRAGLGVAYHAKPIVAAAAQASINVGDLTGLLYLQGYSDTEIIRA